MRTDGGDYNIPFAFLKKRGDKKTKPIFFQRSGLTFVHPAKLSSGLLSSGILSSGLLSQWAFVRSPIVLVKRQRSDGLIPI